MRLRIAICAQVGTFFTSVFMLFTQSTLVSFVLRQTQLRMLRFTGKCCADTRLSFVDDTVRSTLVHSTNYSRAMYVCVALMACVCSPSAVSLQHHVRNRLPVGPLVAQHVIESVVFVPIMVRLRCRPGPRSRVCAGSHRVIDTPRALQLGVLFFMFEFFGDQFLGVGVLAIVWCCEVSGGVGPVTGTHS